MHTTWVSFVKSWDIHMRRHFHIMRRQLFWTPRLWIQFTGYTLHDWNYLNKCGKQNFDALKVFFLFSLWSFFLLRGPIRRIYPGLFLLVWLSLCSCQVVSSYSFDKSACASAINTIDRSGSVMQQSPNGGVNGTSTETNFRDMKEEESRNLEEAWHILYSDCLSALVLLGTRKF